MKHHAPMIDGDEYDALTRFRHWCHWRPGERSAIKRTYRRRERRMLNRRLDD